MVDDFLDAGPDDEGSDQTIDDLLNLIQPIVVSVGELSGTLQEGIQSAVMDAVIPGKRLRDKLTVRLADEVEALTGVGKSLADRLMPAIAGEVSAIMETSGTIKAPPVERVEKELDLPSDEPELPRAEPPAIPPMTAIDDIRLDLASDLDAKRALSVAHLVEPQPGKLPENGNGRGDLAQRQGQPEIADNGQNLDFLRALNNRPVLLKDIPLDAAQMLMSQVTGGTTLPAESAGECCDDQFVTWLDGSSGNCFGRSIDNPPSGSSFLAIGTGRTEEEAAMRANHICVGQQMPVGTPYEEPGYGPPNPFCDVDAYVNPLATFADLSAIHSSRWAAIMSGGGIHAGKFALNTAFSIAGTKVVGDALGGFLHSQAKNMERHMRKWWDKIGCADAAGQSLGLLRITGGVFANWLSPEVNYYMQPLKYATNAACPLTFPSIDAATDAFLANAITELERDTWWKMNGYCVEPMKRVFEARRAKPIPAELIAMFRRGVIDKPGYKAGMRRLGYTVDGDDENLLTISEQRPPISELIRYMVRDADDPALVQQFELDSEFEQKFGEQIKQWALDQGVPEEVMRYSWRSHWTIPGPSQLFEMLHRLSRRPVGDPARVDLATIRTALVQQDILPFWVDKLIATSFRPLPRIDVRRAFDVGALSIAGMVEAFRQIGFNDNDAATLAEFNIRLKKRRAVNELPTRLWKAWVIGWDEARQRLTELGHDIDTIERVRQDVGKQQVNNRAVKRFARGKISRGEAFRQMEAHGLDRLPVDDWLDRAMDNWDRLPIAKNYLRGTVDRSEVVDFYQKNGMPDDTFERIMEQLDFAIKAQTATLCRSSFRKRFLLGELDEVEATEMLVDSGLSADGASRIVDGWICERNAKGKVAPVSFLCGWLEKGTIDLVEFNERLLKLGWSQDDANRVINDCQVKLTLKQEKQAEAMAKAEKAAQEKAAREAKKSAQDLARQREKTAKALEKANVTRRKREVAQLKAADQLRKTDGLDLPIALDEVKRMRGVIMSDFALDLDRAISAVVQAAAKRKGPDEESFETRVREVAQGIRTALDDLDGQSS